MKIAYLISAHTAPDHFIRMVKRLNSDQSVFFVHIDRGSDDLPFKKIENMIGSHKIIWLKRRSMVWAGFNIVRVALDGLTMIAEHPEPIDYACVISGQHYPVKPVEQFHNYLKHNEGKSFIEISEMPRPNWESGGMDRIQYWHFIFKHFRIALPLVSYLKVKLPYVEAPRFRLVKKIIPFIPSARKFPRKYIKGCRPYEGSNWFTLHISLVKEILERIERDGTFYRYYRRTHCADEMFFQSLIMNRLPGYRKHIINNNLTFIKWDRTTGRPFTLDDGYFEEIRQSETFFARKFDTVRSEKLLGEIDKKLLM